MNDKLLTIEQAAQYLNVSKTTLRRWTKSGTLACMRVGAKGERRATMTVLGARGDNPLASSLPSPTSPFQKCSQIVLLMLAILP